FSVPPRGSNSPGGPYKRSPSLHGQFPPAAHNLRTGPIHLHSRRAIQKTQLRPPGVPTHFGEHRGRIDAEVQGDQVVSRNGNRTVALARRDSGVLSFSKGAPHQSCEIFFSSASTAERLHQISDLSVNIGDCGHSLADLRAKEFTAALPQTIS